MEGFTIGFILGVAAVAIVAHFWSNSAVHAKLDALLKKADDKLNQPK